MKKLNLIIALYLGLVGLILGFIGIFISTTDDQLMCSFFTFLGFACVIGVCLVVNDKTF
jgi:hypothetical protein